MQSVIDTNKLGQSWANLRSLTGNENESIIVIQARWRDSRHLRDQNRGTRTVPRKNKYLIWFSHTDVFHFLQ